MNYESSTTKIYWTKDHKKFKFLPGNRDINEAKIKKLIKDVQNGLNLFQYCPILVNETMHIIDGQHRFYACIKLKYNIYYVVVPNFSLAEIARLNNNQNRWKMKDFLNCYIGGENKIHYETLENFIQKYPINISFAVHLLAAGKTTTGGNNLEDFRNGDFTVRHLDEAENLLSMATDYKPFTEFCYHRDFIFALQKLNDNGKYPHAEMIEKLDKNKLSIEKRANPKEYMMHLEELFNFKNSKRKTIF